MVELLVTIIFLYIIWKLVRLPFKMLFGKKNKAVKKRQSSTANSGHSDTLKEILNEMEPSLKVSREKIEKQKKITSQRKYRLHQDYLVEIDKLYPLRKTDPHAMQEVIKYCRKDMAIAKEVMKLQREWNRIIDREDKFFAFPSFEKLAIIYEQIGEYEKAIDVSKHAVRLGLHDPKRCTSPRNYKGRIQRLRKQIAKRDEVKNR